MLGDVPKDGQFFGKALAKRGAWPTRGPKGLDPRALRDCTTETRCNRQKGLACSSFSAVFRSRIPSLARAMRSMNFFVKVFKELSNRQFPFMALDCCPPQLDGAFVILCAELLLPRSCI